MKLMKIITLMLSALLFQLVSAGAQPTLWVSDSSLPQVNSKAQLSSYLDFLQSRGIVGVWVPATSPDGSTVIYEKTDFSSLPTTRALMSGDWANEDFLSVLISEAHARGMKVILTVPASNHSAWEKNPGWRKLDSKGKDVLAYGDLRNFCANSPYWSKVFLPVLKEIAANYEVDGFHLDVAQLLYGTEDACFCQYCKKRFQDETGTPLPPKPVSRSNWSDPAVKLHVIKRVEWVNRLLSDFASAVTSAKPTAQMIISTGECELASDAVSYRFASATSKVAAPWPVNAPLAYAISRVDELKKQGKPARDLNKIALDEIIPGMNMYDYYQFLVKLSVADGGKPVIPVGKTCLEPNLPRAVDAEIAQIESAFSAGAAGYCFYGPLCKAVIDKKTAGTAWEHPGFIEYLKSLTSGERAKWMADMKPDSRVAILCDRDSAFWNNDEMRLLNSAGGFYSAQQCWRKYPVSLLTPSEPDEVGLPASGHKLSVDLLKGYDLVIAAGLDYVPKEDLRVLRQFADSGGRVMIAGGIGGHAKFLGEPITDEAYEILGIVTVGPPEPSGYVLPVAQHPVFTVPGGFSGPMGSFRISEDKNAAPSYKTKYDDKWEVLAHEVTDSGRRAALLMREEQTTNMGYMNSDMAANFSPEMRRILDNMAVVTTGRSTSIVPSGLSATAGFNAFKSADGMARYLYISTLDGESETSYRIRANPGTYPISAQLLTSDGKVTNLKITEENRGPEPLEMTVVPKGNGVLKLPAVKPPFALVRVQYEKRETPQ